MWAYGLGLMVLGWVIPWSAFFRNASSRMSSIVGFYLVGGPTPDLA